MSRSPAHPSHPSSFSPFAPGAIPRIPTRVWCVMVNATPLRMSCSHMPPGTFVIVRSLPFNVTPCRTCALPLVVAVNQISSPAGDHSIPCCETHPEGSEEHTSELQSLRH